MIRKFAILLFTSMFVLVGYAGARPRVQMPETRVHATSAASKTSGAKAEPERSCAFSFENAAQKAEALAALPYQEPKMVPKFLSDMGYDQWRGIRFDPNKALWNEDNLPFRVQLFHPGYLYRQSVQIHIVGPDDVKNVPFSRDLFIYGQSNFDQQLPDDLGFAGFRVHYPLNREGVLDEVIVFLGASYFRAVAEGQQYGLSARGLAVNTTLSGGEEFPSFREFWIVRPEAADKDITIFALLDGPSVTGAYKFVVKPGKETKVDVKARLWARDDVRMLGIAPATSMFYFGEHTPLESKLLDFRPEVHDSDGLSFSLGNGDSVWRPLMNPRRLQINSFHAIDLKHYALLQRDGDFEHYQDLETRYEARPSLWIEPAHDDKDNGVWKDGAIELVQIPTQNEYNDNIVAFWVPATTFAKGSRMDFSYGMRWTSAAGTKALAIVKNTLASMSPDKQKRKFIIDFIGPALDSLTEDAPPEAEISLTGGHAHLARKQVIKNGPAGTWRLIFEIEGDRPKIEQVLPMADVVEMRAQLKKGDTALTETWSYATEF